MTGLGSFGAEKFEAATKVSAEEWRQEMPLHAEMVEGKLADKAPPELMKRFEELKSAFA
jgi:GTP-dependent phosphoenolpyruvate carboxykinase